MRKFKGRIWWVVTHMPLSQRTGVEVETKDPMSKINQEADPSLERR